MTTWQPLSAKKLALTSLTSGGRSVGIVHLWTEGTQFFIGTFSKLCKKPYTMAFRRVSEIKMSGKTSKMHTKQKHEQLATQQFK
jgi:hypothetical protein